MKKILSLAVFTLALLLDAHSQDVSAKERAQEIASNEFSKAKYKRKEKAGVIKEMNKVIESTPVVFSNPSSYQGNYVVQGFNHQLEIRQDLQHQWLVTLTMDGTRTVLKNVAINDAYFSARKPVSDGSDEEWEGAFINKNDNGEVDFGLGIRLATPMRFQSINITKLFFKKVSP